MVSGELFDHWSVIFVYGFISNKRVFLVDFRWSGLEIILKNIWRCANSLFFSHWKELYFWRLALIYVAFLSILTFFKTHSINKKSKIKYHLMLFIFRYILCQFVLNRAIFWNEIKRPCPTDVKCFAKKGLKIKKKTHTHTFV